MRATTLVQATADVITIVSLKAGDVYKRLEENTYGGEKYTLLFGVVQDVLHNGEDAVITAIEFNSNGWSSVEPKVKAFGTDADLKMFSAQPDEVTAHFGELMKIAERGVEDARREMEKKREVLRRIDSIATSGMELTAPATVALEG